nr:hypothetical protein [Tanacetum cinerariifolium]
MNSGRSLLLCVWIIMTPRPQTQIPSRLRLGCDRLVSEPVQAVDNSVESVNNSVDDSVDQVVNSSHHADYDSNVVENENLTVNENLGAARVHNLYTGLKGSSSLIHGTKTKFQSFTCRIDSIIRDSDAQMFINQMEDGKKYTPNFSFGYYVKNRELCGLFELMKLHSATTKSLIVLSLLLLRAFIKVFVRVPNIFVIDEDGTMKEAVVVEFLDVKHTLCIWHIMQKLPAKIVSRTYDDIDYKSKLNKIVWNTYMGRGV